MKRIKKNYLLLIISVLLICLISSCVVECINHVDSNDDGICDICQYQMKKDYECPECGTKNSEDANFCSECGIKVSVLAKCANCGKNNDSNNKYCTNCGKFLVVKCEHSWNDATYTEPKTCTKCGSTVGEKLECTTHTDENEDLLCDNCGTITEVVNPECEHNWNDATYTEPKTCTKCGATEGEKLECTTHIDENEDSLCDNCNTTIEKPVIKEYKPKWKPNQQTGGWNGNGMEVKILVTPVSAYDPFDLNYSNPDKKILQKQIRNIEQAYGIDLVFEEYSYEASWGPSRIEYIKQMYNNGTLTNTDVYAGIISTNWIPTLVKAGCLAELASIDVNFDTFKGIFAEVGYKETSEGSNEYVQGAYMQDNKYNQLSAYLNKVFGYIPNNYNNYGYTSSKPQPDYFMYYNVDMIKEANMEDPAELWFRGEWTWSLFQNYVEELQSKLDNEQYALAVEFPRFIIGSTASTGGKIATSRPSLALTSSNVIDKFKYTQNLVSKGYCDKGYLYDAIPTFTNGYAAFTTGEIWFLNSESRFNQRDLPFTIGAVPYPTSDGDMVKPITTQNESEAIKNIDNKPIETYPGSLEYICCIDMTNSSYMIPVTSKECYSIFNTTDGKNGINNKIIFAILYDLYSGLGEDPEELVGNDETNYRNWLKQQFNYEIHVETIMSVQDCTYVDLIENVSYQVGGGSQFGSSAFWSLATNICINSSVDPAIKLYEVLDEYKYVMRSFGYNL